ncbi:hypothetical protein H2198_006652 [Neophaeococcomyces mojaviensis]|uniref:Uncharacterized protein n=1 Tax=Neophaeococcomyces mojaviensis TaxID=3383035 RepID=A0ACC3A2L1_9EURO|nr:hypothetical protein H2198_006652 [Knufia sp. JES_112]
MRSESSDLGSLTDDDIVEICHAGGASTLTSDVCGRKVVVLNDNIVVKFGLGVTVQEAAAQRLAFETVDRSIVRVPKVFRFFDRLDMDYWSTGYLVMEYVKGSNLAEVAWEEETMLPRVAAAIKHINATTNSFPGPVSGGKAQGSLWSEIGSDTAFHNIEELEAYMNRRLSVMKESISLTNERLCLCHLDPTPRNFMIDVDGHLFLVDWATAGFYPRYFQLWSIEFTQHVLGDHFTSKLLDYLAATKLELVMVERLWSLYRYNARCAQ